MADPHELEDGGLHAGRENGEAPTERTGAGGVADTSSGGQREQRNAGKPRSSGHADGSRIVGHSLLEGLEGLRGHGHNGNEPGRIGAIETGPAAAPGPVNGFWGNAIWIPCIDGKSRPIEPGTFPLVAGAPSRVGRLRADGNAINAEQACAFIRAYREVRGEL